MDKIRKIGVLFVVLALFSTAALGQPGAHYGGPETDDDFEDETEYQDENETEDDDGGRFGRPEDAGKPENVTAGRPENVTGGRPEEAGEQGNLTRAMNRTQAGQLTGHERAIQAITRAQQRLAEQNKTAPGLQVALDVLAIAQETADEANETADEEEAGAKARMAAKLARKAEQMNQGDLAGIQNEYRERAMARAQLGEVDDEELEDDIDEELDEEDAEKLKGKIKAMSDAFKSRVRSLIKNGTAEEKAELAQQLGEEAPGLQIAEKVRSMDKERIREALGEGATAEELSSEAV